MVQSFGKVSVPSAGTPVRATTNLSTTGRVTLQSVMFQALPSNAGLVYIYASRSSPGDDRTNLTKCIGILAVPSSGTTGPFPSATFSIPSAEFDLDLQEFWLDTSLSGAAVIVTGTHGRKEPYL